MNEQAEILAELRDIRKIAETRKKEQRQSSIIYLSAALIFFAYMIYKFHKTFTQDGSNLGAAKSSKSLADNSGDVSVTNTQFSLVDASCGDTCSKDLIFIGTIENASGKSIENPEFEVSFYNSVGKLVDVLEKSMYGVKIANGKTLDFRAAGKAVTSDASQYLDFKIKFTDGDYSE